MFILGALILIVSGIKWGLIGINNAIWLMSPVHSYVKIAWLVWLIICLIITYASRLDAEETEVS